MPENCKSCTLRDANNNTYPVPLNANLSERGSPPSSRSRSIHVTAKVLFGSVHAITRLKQEEKVARENKRSQAAKWTMILVAILLTTDASKHNLTKTNRNDYHADLNEEDVKDRANHETKTISQAKDTTHNSIITGIESLRDVANSSTNMENESGKFLTFHRSGQAIESGVKNYSIDTFTQTNKRSGKYFKGNEALEAPKNLVGLSQVKIDEAVKAGMKAAVELMNYKEPLWYRMGLVLDEDDPAARVANFGIDSKRAMELSKFGYASVEASKKIAQLYPQHVSREANFFQSLRSRAISDECPIRGRPRCSPFTRKYRTADGTCNNLAQPWRGAALMPMQRFLPPVYEDGIQEVRLSVLGRELPSARQISVAIHGEKNREMKSVTLMLMQWGQFLDHDITSTAKVRSFNASIPRCCAKAGRGFLPPELTHPECLPIEVASDDWFLGAFGVRCMEFIRSAPSTRIDCDLGWREQINLATPYIDGSAIYGSDEDTLESIRTFKNGKLQYGRIRDEEDFQPPDPPDGELCRSGALITDCFQGADGRLGEQTGLTAMHTLWVRYHNRIATLLGKLNLHWSDERIFQETRRIIGASIQHITYKEFLPIVLGREVMQLFELMPERLSYYKGYNEKVNPAISNAFSTAAFRFGHSLVQNSYMRFDAKHRPLFNNVSLHQELANAPNIWTPGSVDRLILGLCNQPSQRRDESVCNELSNHLFQSSNAPFGQDLASINIQRGRDHGIPPYTAWRHPCGLTELKTWKDLESVMHQNTVDRLRSLYAHLDDIDLFTAGLAEKPVRGGIVGPTFACIIAQQFLNLRQGDRFWYENNGFESSFTPAQLQQIRRITLAQILCVTMTEVDTIQPFVFLAADDFRNVRLRCDSPIISNFDFTPWKEKDIFDNRIERSLSGQKEDFKEEVQKQRGQRSVDYTERIRRIKLDPSEVAISQIDLKSEASLTRSDESFKDSVELFKALKYSANPEKTETDLNTLEELSNADKNLELSKWKSSADLNKTDVYLKSQRKLAESGRNKAYFLNTSTNLMYRIKVNLNNQWKRPQLGGEVNGTADLSKGKRLTETAADEIDLKSQDKLTKLGRILRNLVDLSKAKINLKIQANLTKAEVNMESSTELAKQKTNPMEVSKEQKSLLLNAHKEQIALKSNEQRNKQISLEVSNDKKLDTKRPRVKKMDNNFRVSNETIDNSAQREIKAGENIHLEHSIDNMNFDQTPKTKMDKELSEKLAIKQEVALSKSNAFVFLGEARSGCKPKRRKMQTTTVTTIKPVTTTRAPQVTTSRFKIPIVNITTNRVKIQNKRENNNFGYDSPGTAYLVNVAPQKLTEPQSKPVEVNIKIQYFPPTSGTTKRPRRRTKKPVTRRPKPTRPTDEYYDEILPYQKPYRPNPYDFGLNKPNDFDPYHDLTELITKRPYQIRPTIPQSYQMRPTLPQPYQIRPISTYYDTVFEDKPFSTSRRPIIYKNPLYIYQNSRFTTKRPTEYTTKYPPYLYYVGDKNEHETDRLYTILDDVPHVEDLPKKPTFGYPNRKPTNAFAYIEKIPSTDINDKLDFKTKFVYRPKRQKNRRPNDRRDEQNHEIKRYSAQNYKNLATNYETSDSDGDQPYDRIWPYRQTSQSDDISMFNNKNAPTADKNHAHIENEENMPHASLINDRNMAYIERDPPQDSHSQNDKKQPFNEDKPLENDWFLPSGDKYPTASDREPSTNDKRPPTTDRTRPYSNRNQPYDRKRPYSDKNRLQDKYDESRHHDSLINDRNQLYNDEDTSADKKKRPFSDENPLENNMQYDNKVPTNNEKPSPYDKSGPYRNRPDNDRKETNNDRNHPYSDKDQLDRNQWYSNTDHANNDRNHPDNNRNQKYGDRDQPYDDRNKQHKDEFLPASSKRPLIGNKFIKISSVTGKTLIDADYPEAKFREAEEDFGAVDSLDAVRVVQVDILPSDLSDEHWVVYNATAEDREMPNLSYLGPNDQTIYSEELPRKINQSGSSKNQRE